MNDFDDRLSKALLDDGLDVTRRPDLDDARRGWRRRRRSRLAGTAGVLSVLAVGAGFGIATLAQNDPGERLVTDTVSTESVTTETAATTAPATTIVGDPVVPATVVAVPATADSVPPTTDTPASAPSNTEAPETASSINSNPATETRGLDVASGFTARTTVFDIDNRLEIRSATNEVLWSYQYCEVGQSCNASVQTVLDDGFWVLVGERTDENGFPSSSTLRRVGIDGTTTEVHAESPLGTYFAAAQPTVLGDLIAVTNFAAPGRGWTTVSVTSADGNVTELIAGVNGVEVSADGRYLATTSAQPSEDYGRVYLTVFDLQTGETNEITIQGVVTAAPLEFSVDGSQLVIRNNWELRSDFVIDPWTSSSELVAPDIAVNGAEACLVDASTAAVATWTPGYAEEGSTTGTVRIVDIGTGNVVNDRGLDTFGRQLVCGPDGSVTFVRVPLVEMTFGTEDDPFTIVEQDFDAPVDVVRVAPDGTQTVLESGTVNIGTIR